MAKYCATRDHITVTFVPLNPRLYHSFNCGTGTHFPGAMYLLNGGVISPGKFPNCPAVQINCGKPFSSARGGIGASLSMFNSSPCAATCAFQPLSIHTPRKCSKIRKRA